MRYFQATSELFDSMRSMVMDQLDQPNDHAEQPWPVGITSIGLSPHEYEPPHYADLIEYALANGAVEITAEQFAALQPDQNE